jgi:hypothetical protein
MKRSCSVREWANMGPSMETSHAKVCTLRAGRIVAGRAKCGQPKSGPESAPYAGPIDGEGAAGPPAAAAARPAERR